jgi:tyrosyl-DNA phosphodiesterase-1
MFRLKSSGNVARELSWMYMGSHNLSKSSWGEEQLQGRQFKVLSFEIGVVFIPALISRCAKVPISLVLGKGNVADGPRVPGISCKNDPNVEELFKFCLTGQIVLPIPYRYPAESYSAKHSGSERPDDMPWQWDVAYHKPDVFGKQWPGIGSI